MAYLQLIRHNLIGMLPMCLTKIFVKKDTMTDCQTTINTIYKHRNVLADNTFVYDLDDVYCVWQNQLYDDNSVEISLDIFECEDGVYYREVSKSAQDTNKIKTA